MSFQKKALLVSRREFISDFVMFSFLVWLTDWIFDLVLAISLFLCFTTLIQLLPCLGMSLWAVVPLILIVHELLPLSLRTSLVAVVRYRAHGHCLNKRYALAL